MEGDGGRAETVNNNVKHIDWRMLQSEALEKKELFKFTVWRRSLQSYCCAVATVELEDTHLHLFSLGHSGERSGYSDRRLMGPSW